ncbi:hypothetical protein BGZ65_009336 [Modicella reniformis]|uniref:Uncharacterized protein n=1 Tax=Modicella reniformis TaxID=1440133 RepID=A0A9P6ME63_9FUNG|nr:hypothetical protein BGZ65_009336 [Modicella reniformis]
MIEAGGVGGMIGGAGVGALSLAGEGMNIGADAYENTRKGAEVVTVRAIDALDGGKHINNLANTLTKGIAGAEETKAKAYSNAEIAKAEADSRARIAESESKARIEEAKLKSEALKAQVELAKLGIKY